MRAEIIGGIDDWANQLNGPGGFMLVAVGLGAFVAKDALQERFRPTPEQQVVRSVKKGLRRYLNIERKTQRNNNPQPARFINGIASEWALLTSMYPSGTYSTSSKPLGVRNPVIHKFMLIEEGNSLTIIHNQYKDPKDEEPIRFTRLTLTADEYEIDKVGRLQVAHSHTNVGIDFHLLRDDYPRQRAEAASVIRSIARPMQRAL